MFRSWIFVWLHAVLLIPAALGEDQRPIEGAINADKALKYLYSDPDAKAAEDSGTVVDVYATQEGVIDGKKVWFLYTTSNTKDNTCHACTVTLGAAMFEQQGAAWIKRADDRDLSRIGSYGAPLASKPVQWGRQSYGLVVDGGWVGYGQVTAFQTLYGFVDGSFRPIFSLQLGDDNGASLAPDSEKYGWEAKWKFGPPGPDGIYDLVITLDAKNSYPRLPANRKGVPVPGVYRYNGSSYKHLQKGVVLAAE